MPVKVLLLEPAGSALKTSTLGDCKRGSFTAGLEHPPAIKATVSHPASRPMATVAFIVREKAAWCSQRGVAHIKITESLFNQPGTTLMRPACNALIPAPTTEAG